MEPIDSTIVEFNLTNRTHRTLGVADFLEFEMDPAKVYWIHCDLSNSQIFKQLTHKLNLPKETIKLCSQKNTLSKLIESEQTITLKFLCLLEKEFKKNRDEHFGDLIMHLTNQYCFTASRKTLPAIMEFKEHYNKAMPFAKTSCFILFLVLDNVINDYAQFLSNFEVMSDQMDIKVRENHENIYSEIAGTKHRVMEIKRCTVAVREILMRLSGRKIHVISEECRLSLSNLFNQSQMIFHEIDSIRDMLNGLLSQIDYSLMRTMNKTMQILTAFAAIFLPLTLITGIYGMNFIDIPELKWHYGYYYALALILFCGLALLWLFRKMKWF